MPIPETSLAALIARYQVFFLDQFGVLRDDEGAYPGAAEALQALKAAGKTVVILSNSGRSGVYNADRFVGLGFARESFDAFVTSGDAAYTALKGAGSPLPPGAACLTVSSGGDRNLAERLNLRHVEDGESADLVVISGSESERIPMEAYADLLRPAAARGIPAICTNPDIHKLSAGGLAPAAGAIAQLYEGMGGSVRWFGKPHRDIYDLALATAGHPPAEKVVCVGDSIDHDILGAHDAGLAGVLVRTGILAELSTEALEAKASGKLRPDAIMSAFRPD